MCEENVRSLQILQSEMKVLGLRLSALQQKLPNLDGTEVAPDYTEELHRIIDYARNGVDEGVVAEVLGISDDTPTHGLREVIERLVEMTYPGAHRSSVLKGALEHAAGLGAEELFEEAASDDPEA